MKTYRHSMFRPLLAIAAACLTLAACVAPGPKKALPERVQVSWAPDNQLTEVRNNSFQRGWLKPEDWQKTLSTYLRQRADAILPPGRSSRSNSRTSSSPVTSSHGMAPTRKTFAS